MVGISGMSYEVGANGNSQDEMRGSLHCATDGETVRCFGRDDASGVDGEKQATARTKATANDKVTAKATATAVTGQLTVASCQFLKTGAGSVFQFAS